MATTVTRRRSLTDVGEDLGVPLLSSTGDANGNVPELTESPATADVDDALGEDEGLTFSAVLAILSAAANLMATSMGTGILALPIAVYYSGAVTGTVMIIAMAIISDVSLVFLVEAAKHSGLGTLQQMGRFYYGPKGELMVNVSLILLLLCASLSILIAVQDLIAPLYREWLPVDHYQHWWAKDWFIMLLCIVVIYPISISSNLKPLTYSSSGAVMSIILVFVLMNIRFCQHGVSKEGGIQLFVDSPVAALALPIQGLAYCNQFNVVGLYNELGPHKKHVYKVIHLSAIVTCVVYAIFGLVGYLYFGKDTKKYSMILAGFHNDKLMDVAGLMISVTNILKFPLIILPFRQTINFILFGEADYSLTMSAFETFLLLAVIYVLAWVVGDLALALELSGPTVGVFICFILPAMLYFKSEKGVRSRKRSRSLGSIGESKNDLSRSQIAAMIVGFLGIFMGLGTITGLIFQNT